MDKEMKEYADAINGGIGADRMMHGLGIIPDPIRGDLETIIALEARNAELVAALDKHHGVPCEQIRHREEVDDLKARNARLLAALRFYAATESYMTLRLRTEYGKEGNQRLGTDRPDVIIDNGNRARAAIAAEEKEQSK